MIILRHGWNIHYGNNKNLWNKSNNVKKQSSNHDFQRYYGYTPIDDVVSRDKQEFVILALLPLRVTRWRSETCVDRLPSSSGKMQFRAIWRPPMTQVGEIPSSYIYLIISDSIL